MEFRISDTFTDSLAKLTGQSKKWSKPPPLTCNSIQPTPDYDSINSTTHPPLFTHIPTDELLNYGIPSEWLEAVQQATEDTLFDLIDHLPQEAAEALLELAIGNQPPIHQSQTTSSDPFNHPDAQRRFRVMNNLEELQRALDYPWEKWTVFLHPAQRHLVERDYNGPARISGSAGTGKTIVALHRAVFLARRHPNATILLTTFSAALANTLQLKLDRLVGNESAIHERIVVRSLPTLAHELYTDTFGPPQLAQPEFLKSLLHQIAQQQDSPGFSSTFLWNEWHEIVDAWQVKTWEDYRNVPRLGRKTRLGSKQRQSLWAIFHQILQTLSQQGLMTEAELFQRVTQTLATAETIPFQFAIVDEAQDLSISQLRFLATLGHHAPDSLFFTGDLGQRIFQQPYSWKSLGVDIRGRSHTLKINYRTSHQIRTAADRLLPNSITDVDGIQADRRNTISTFNGPTPQIKLCEDVDDEIECVGTWITHCLSSGI